MRDALAALLGRGTLTVRDANTGALQAVGVVETVTVRTTSDRRKCGLNNRNCGDIGRAHDPSNPTTS